MVAASRRAGQAALPARDGSVPAASSSKGKGRALYSFDENDDDDDEELDFEVDQLPSTAGRGVSQMQSVNGTGSSVNNDDRPVHPTSTLQATDERDEDCIKILLATDNHIGYNERDPVRGRDSIETFREILQLAVANDVDMLLLAGDLFHENKPSRASLHQTIALLREHCMGPRPISLEIVSDAGVGLKTGYDFPPINYEDPNYNIGLPVFSIHGNHDDPQGSGPEGALCALDILSASGLVNYFGRQDLPGEASTDEEARASGIQVKPVLLKKGDTKLAMFGIGNIRDERFHAEMRKNRISMFRPAQDPDDWFNLLLIHQNRVPHGPKSSVPENGFGDEVDLVVWGHEHDCRIDPEPVTGKGYYIVQPGSSIATSLSPGESTPKHVALLKIQAKSFIIEKLRLRTVRPFIMDDVVLDDITEIEGVALDTKVKVNQYLKGRVNELVEKANQEWDELYEEDENPPPRMLPLIRLRVQYSNHEVGNPQRFGQDFTNRVANPRDIVQFYKKKAAAERKAKVAIDLPEDLENQAPERVEKVKVETLVRQYLEAQTLQVLHENGIGHAVNAYVEKDDKHAIDSFITKTLEQHRKQIEKDEVRDDNDTDEEIEQGVQHVKDRLAQQFEEKNASKGKERQRQSNSDEDEDDDFDQMSVDNNSDNARSRKQAPAKGKGKASALFNQDSESEEESSDPPPTKKKAAPRSTASKAKAAPKAKAPARKTTAPVKKQTQSQLGFAPSRGAGGSSRAAAKISTARSKPTRDNSGEEEEEEDDDDGHDDPSRGMTIEIDDSESDAPSKRRTTKKR